MDGGKQDSVVHGSGQSVNVSVGLGPMAIICAFLLAILVILAFNVRSAAKAELRAEAAETAAKTYATELRMTQFWMQRASTACQAAGADMPAIPASLMKAN